MQRSPAFFQWEWKVTKQETTKLQSQLSNYNKKQNMRKVERCGSHRFEEDREVTMDDGREKKLSASASTSTSTSTLCLKCVRARFFLLQNPFLSLITEICWCFEFYLIFCFVFLIFFFFLNFIWFFFSFPSQIILSFVLWLGSDR